MSWVATAAVASAVVAVCILAGVLVYRLRKGAQAEIRAGVAEARAESEHAQTAAALRRPDTRGELVDRVRDGL